MLNMGKTIGELHALLIEYEKGLPKKAATPQVMAIQGVSKNNGLYFNTIPSDGISKIDMLNLVPNVNYIYNDSYFITFTDDYSHYDYMYLLKHIHAVFETFTVFKNEVENQLGKTIKALRSDRGGKYISQEFKDYLKGCGIFQQFTPPYTPQHNKVSERRIHTLLDMIRSMMNLTTLSLSFWDYALETATRIINMVPTKKVDKTSYELWHGKVPNLSYLKVWGCEALVKWDTSDKLQQRSVNGRAKELKEIQDKDASHSENTSEIPVEVEEVEEHSLRDLNEPNNYKDAILDPEFDKWVDAMNAKMQSIKDNQVWCLVDLPPNCKTVGSKWLNKKKSDMDGIVHTYKAHLVGKGYTQTYRVDYEETFSPIADIRAIRILIAITTFKIDNSKRGNIPMQERFDLNKTQGASTPEEVKRCKMYPMLWQNIKDMILVYDGNPEAELIVDCYCNAVFETNRDDIRSQTRYVSVLNRGVVDWKSSKQSTTAMSAT
ncbi:retrovirus-related pol polyprotein from transposon TNT 1-94 [Tanacetum coccineum]